MNRLGLRLNALQMLAIGFAMLVIIGAALLCLPIANRDGESIPFLNALFTSTSATCVTGLIVYDTWQQFSLFGQAVILVLIQIGGLGFMTIAIMFSMLLGKRIGLKERSYLKEAVSSFQIGGVVRLSRRILIVTALMELLGTALLAIRFVPMFGFLRGVWFALFHSIASFCNAGFDLMGIVEPYSSLTLFVGDPLVVGTIMGLIVVGGLGFLVWNDFLDHKLRFSKYQLHTRVILISTLALITISTAALYFVERDASMKGMDSGTRVLASLFQAITPRTTGSNTVDLAAMSEPGSAVVMINMFIGAGPGSTAGGVKISTVVVILMSLVSYTRGIDDVNILKRRLSPGIERRAYCGMLLYLFIAVTGCFAILCFDPVGIHDAMYETLSAIGTVGLTRGITRALSEGSLIVLILLMYAGRVGSLSVAMALTDRTHTHGLKNPIGHIIVG